MIVILRQVPVPAAGTDSAVKAWDILYTELGGATQLEGKREGNRIVQTEINEKNIQWVFSEITTTSFRWQRMVKRPDGTWETEAELFAVRR